jgi:hypothetical protein
MSRSEVVVEGTLKPDGTLELDQQPKLAPGRVRVVLQPVDKTSPSQMGESLWEFLRRTRRELEGAGSHFMSEDEVQAHIDWLHEPDRIDELLRQGEQS